MVCIAQRLEEQQAELEALRQRQDTGAEERANEMESRLEVCENVSDVYADALSDMKVAISPCSTPPPPSQHTCVLLSPQCSLYAAK